MTIHSVFDAIPLVTTPLSLIAFLAAVGVLAHARAIGRAEKLIKLAPEDNRRTLVAGALDILDLKAGQLTREQRYDLALETLKQRRLRSILAFSVCVIFGVICAGVAFNSVVNVEPDKVVNDLLTSDKKNAAMGELRRHGVFDAGDSDIVKYLADKTSVPREDEVTLSEGALIEIASKKYESVPSVKELRRRALVKEEPFRPLGEKQIATVPSNRDDQPRQFFLNVPKGSQYAYKVVKITNPENGKYLRLFAKPAIDDGSRGTDMHLNKEQAAFIFGGPLIPAKGNVIIRETIEPIYDPECSKLGRSVRFSKISELACKQGASVEVSFLQSTLSGQ